VPKRTFAFSAGEISAKLLGRADLQNYTLGAAKLHNMTVNFGGGAKKRDGLRFVAELQNFEDLSSLLPIVLEDPLYFTLGRSSRDEATVSQNTQTIVLKSTDIGSQLAQEEKFHYALGAASRDQIIASEQVMYLIIEE